MFQTGDIVIVDLLPVVGHEQGSLDARPCLVVAPSPERCGRYYELLTIVPFTTTLTRGCGALTPVLATPTKRDPDRRSRVLVPQLRSIDPQRVKRKVSSAPVSDVDTVRKAMKDYLQV
ncbi:MAG: type II toxin-antitoxin system PemK/MazF family toxin [Trueperaceae bacterium]|nr:type II toxin-antitoxin system PemK/MazF family toxin [Trueperaceae bacterium]